MKSGTRKPHPKPDESHELITKVAPSSFPPQLPNNPFLQETSIKSSPPNPISLKNVLLREP